MNNIRRIMAIVIKEYQHIKRDPVSLRIPLLMPIIWILVLFPAFILTPTNLELKINDKMPPEIINKIEENENIIITDDSNNELTYEENTIVLKLDDSDYLNTKALSYEVGKTLNTGNKIQFENMYDIDDNTNIFIIPALIGLVLQNIVIFLSALSLVKEKESGTSHHLLHGPVKYFEIVIGKIIPYFIIGIVDMIILLSISVTIFEINFVNLPLFFFICLLFILSCLSMGILISTISKNQMQALLYTIFLLLPSVLISGMIFPIESMPNFLQTLSKLMPLTHFNLAAREIVIKSSSISDISIQIVSLLMITFVTISLSIYLLNKNKYNE